MPTHPHSWKKGIFFVVVVDTDMQADKRATLLAVCCSAKLRLTEGARCGQQAEILLSDSLQPDGKDHDWWGWCRPWRWPGEDVEDDSQEETTLDYRRFKSSSILFFPFVCLIPVLPPVTSCLSVCAFLWSHIFTVKETTQIERPWVSDWTLESYRRSLNKSWSAEVDTQRRSYKERRRKGCERKD